MNKLFSDPDTGIYGDQGNNRPVFCADGLAIDCNDSSAISLLCGDEEKVTRFGTTQWMIDGRHI